MGMSTLHRSKGERRRPQPEGFPASVHAVACATGLLQARRHGLRLPLGSLAPRDRGEAYAIQDETLGRLGPVGGWKVSARDGEGPACAPLPAEGLLPAPVRLGGPAWRLRGVQLEVAFRLRRDLPARPGRPPYDADEVAQALGSVMPAVELVESRLDDWLAAGREAQLADLLSHGALVLGREQRFEPRWLQLGRAEARLRFNDTVVANTVGGHPTGDVGTLLAWLANHCVARGRPLQAGQVLTTGSCTGMVFASAGDAVQAEIGGLSPVALAYAR